MSSTWKINEYYYRYSTRSWYRITKDGAIFVEDKDVPLEVRRAILVDEVSIREDKKLS